MMLLGVAHPLRLAALARVRAAILFRLAGFHCSLVTKEAQYGTSNRVEGCQLGILPLELQ